MFIGKKMGICLYLCSYHWLIIKSWPVNGADDTAKPLQLICGRTLQLRDNGFCILMEVVSLNGTDSTMRSGTDNREPSLI